MHFDIYRKFRIHRTKIIFLGSFLAVFIFFVISLNFFVYRVLDDTERVQFLRSRPWLVKTLPILRSVRKITDLADIFYYFKSSDLPVYSLKIDPANVKKLEDALPEGFTEEVFTDKFYVPAKFYADGREYDVKVRYRGDNSIHWESDKKSYLIKFDDENLFNGISRLSFIIPDDRKFAVEQLNNYRAEKLGLKHPISYFGNLKVNGRNNGLYFLIENWSSEMEAKWEIPDPSNLYGGADPIIWLGRTVDEDLWQNVGLWDLKVDNKLLGYEHYSEIYKLLDIINNYNDEDFKNSIFNLVDKDTFFSWLVHQNLSHSNHQTGPNLRMYFNYSDGKFYVVSWDVDNFPAEENIDSVYNDLITRVLSQPEFVYERNKLLWNYVSDKENLEDDLKEYDRIIESIRVDLYKDRLKIYTNNWADNLISTRRQFYEDIFNSIRESLKQSRVFSDLHIELDRRNNIFDKDLLAYIDITVDSHPEVFWQDFRIPLKESVSDYYAYNIYKDDGDNIFDEDDIYITELVKNSDGQLSFNGGDQEIILYAKREVGNMYESILPIPNKQRFFIVSQNGEDYKNWALDDIDISFDNAITGKKITGEEKQFKVINDSIFTYFDDLSKSPEDFLLDFPQFRFIDNHFVLSSGQYYFDRNVIIPSNYDLIIEPGTVISMASDISIVVHGAIIADGSKNRIYINSSSNEPWGTLVSLSSKKENVFKNFWADNGSESYINGTYVSGMVSVHDGDVILENSLFTRANGDDSFNLKWGNAQIINNNFSNNKFDALDVDWGEDVVISGNTFIGNGNDGMDIGGGNNMKIFNNIVENSGDKCVSIGESAKNVFIFNNWLERCVYGLAVKDNSDIIGSNNTLLYNQIGVGAYQKKPVWGGATVEIYNSVIWWSDKIIDIDEKSSINIEYSNIQGEFGEKNNINVEPLYNNKKLINEEEFFIKGANMDIIKEFTNKNFAPMGAFDL